MSAAVTRSIFGRIGPWGTAANVGFAGYEVNRRQKEHPDESKAMSLAAAGVQFAMWQFAWPLALGYELSKAAAPVGHAIGQAHATGWGRNHGLLHGQAGKFIDSANKATLRQRSASAVNESRENVRSALGSEARRIRRNRYGG